MAIAEEWEYSASCVRACARKLVDLPMTLGTQAGDSEDKFLGRRNTGRDGYVFLYDWDDDGIYDHESIVVASDGPDTDGTPNWDLVDAHTNNRYHAY